MQQRLIHWRILIGLFIVFGVFFSGSLPQSTQIASADEPIVIEAESEFIVQSGSWTRIEDAKASGGAYLVSSGTSTDMLELAFAGSYLEVRYVMQTSTGTLAIEVDNQVMRTVRPGEENVLAGTINYLDDKDHLLRIYSEDGVVAVDALVVSRLVDETPDSIFAPSFGPAIVGDFRPMQLQQNYASATHNALQTIRHSGASYIKVHFQNLNLPPGDTITVSNPYGTEVHTYPGDGFTIHSDTEPGFWALSIIGDTVNIEVHSSAQNETISDARYGYSIDQYAFGFPDLQNITEDTRSTCGVTERPDAVCFSGTHPTEFERTEPVGVLLLGGFEACTMWRVGPGNLVFTNEHCITNQAQANASEMRFNWQRQTCGGALLPGTTVSVDQFVMDHFVLDFALVTLENFPAIEQFGFLELDVRQPNVLERIYIPQHGNGDPKQLAILSDVDGAAGPDNNCRVRDNAFDGNGTNTDVGYWCDTVGGSSGSPVLSGDTHQVIALHHFGTGAPPNACDADTMNSGARIDLVYPLVAKQFLYAPTTIEYTTTPTFSVPEVAGAQWYRIRAMNSINALIYDSWFPTSQMSCSSGVCSIKPSTPISGMAGNFRWRSQTWSSAAGFSAESATWNFNILSPTLITSGTINDNLGKPTVSWNRLNRGETHYQLYFSGPGGGFDQWVEASVACSTSTCSATPAQPLRAGSNSWFARAWGPEGFGGWTGASTINLTATVLPQIIKGVPNGAGPVTAAPVNFTWTHNANAHSYELYLGGPNGFVDYRSWQAASSCTGGNCSIFINVPTNGSYTWFLRGLNAAGGGAWGPNDAGGNFGAVTFNVAVPNPSHITKLDPVGDNLISGLVNFSWTPNANAVSYEVYVAGPGGWSDYRTWDSATYCAATCNISILVPSNGNYTWYLRGKSAVDFGPWGPTSGNFDPANFSVNAPVVAMVNKTSPIQGANVPTNAITLTWAETANATSYQIYLAGPGGFVNFREYFPGTTAICTAGTCSTTIYTSSNGLHQWYMRARSAAGFGVWGPNDAGGDLGLRTFSVTAPAPAANPTLTAPANAAILANGGNSLTFAWNTVPNATWYSLVLVNRITGAVVSQTWVSAASMNCESSSPCSFTTNVATGSYRWAVLTWGPGSTSVPTYVPGITPTFTFDKLGL